MTEHVTVAFLGLGHMGGPMATNLVAANHAVRGFDPVPAALSAAAAAGVAAFDTAVDAVAGADVVMTMLPNGELVKRCYAEILRRRGPVLCSSTAPRSRSMTPARCMRWRSRAASPSWTRPSRAG